MNIFGEEKRWIIVEHEVLREYERGTPLISGRVLFP
jgi:hypothetical protein